VHAVRNQFRETCIAKPINIISLLSAFAGIELRAYLSAVPAGPFSIAACSSADKNLPKEQYV
jgi:hypothetical protein